MTLCLSTTKQIVTASFRLNLLLWAILETVVAKLKQEVICNTDLGKLCHFWRKVVCSKQLTSCKCNPERIFSQQALQSDFGLMCFWTCWFLKKPQMSKDITAHLTLSMSIHYMHITYIYTVCVWLLFCKHTFLSASRWLVQHQLRLRWAKNSECRPPAPLPSPGIDPSSHTSQLPLCVYSEISLTLIVSCMCCICTALALF